MSIGTLYFNTTGRINRKAYLVGILPLIGLTVAAFVIDQMVQSRVILDYGVFQLLALALIFWPSLCLGIKRLHDRNRPWWFVLLGYVPLVNVWIAVELMCLKGTPGKNVFGKDPLLSSDAA